MNQVRENVPSAKWHTCVSTFKCDVIDEHVSIMVKNDWASHCTWYKEFKGQVPGSPKRTRLDKRTRRKIELCLGPFCSHLTGYRDKLMRDEQEGQ